MVKVRSQRFEILQNRKLFPLGQSIGKRMAGVALSESTCIEVAPANRNIGFEQRYFFDHFNLETDLLVVDPLGGAPPDGRSL